MLVKQRSWVQVVLLALALPATFTPAEAKGPTPPGLQPGLNERRLVLTPELPGHLFSVNTRTLRPARKGILVCDYLPDGICLIANMPLLAQYDDPKRTHFIENFLLNYADPKTDEVSDIGTKNLDRKQYARQQQGVGCYTTSMVTIMSAALANRAAEVQLSHRTKVFDGLGNHHEIKSPVSDLSKPEQQLLWQYESEFRSWEGTGEQPLYFDEVVADIGGGVKEQNCDPYVPYNCPTATALNGLASTRQVWSPSWRDLNNEKVISWMKEDSMVLLAYQRYALTVPPGGLDKKTGILTVHLEDLHTRHKVVVSGFRQAFPRQPDLEKSETFPLIINDVGDGLQHPVVLSSNLADFTAAIAAKMPGSVVKSVKLDAASHGLAAGRPFLVYQGANFVQVYVIEHYDVLYVKPRPG